MATRWERLEGDPGVFATRMAFAPDPDGGRYIDPETGLSWGSFQIWVEGRNLCSHLEEGERIDSAHWYLLPLLERVTRHCADCRTTSLPRAGRARRGGSEGGPHHPRRVALRGPGGSGGHAGKPSSA